MRMALCICMFPAPATFANAVQLRPHLPLSLLAGATTCIHKYKCAAAMDCSSYGGRMPACKVCIHMSAHGHGHVHELTCTPHGMTLLPMCVVLVARNTGAAHGRDYKHDRVALCSAFMGRPSGIPPQLAP